MRPSNRRQFIGCCTALGSTALVNDLGLLATLSRAASSQTKIIPGSLHGDAVTRDLVDLIAKTSRERCIATLVTKIREGLSYQQFLAGLFESAARTNDLHILAQVYAAHRISSQARVEERLLPLFWSLDRIKQSQENQDAHSLMPPLTGPFPKASEAKNVFLQSMNSADKPTAERAIVVMAQTQGPRVALMQLWNEADRDLGGTLGHLPIGTANTYRTLSAIGWEHSTTALRYIAREICRSSVDTTYKSNRERVDRSHTSLPIDWVSSKTSREATLEIYHALRSETAENACDAILQGLMKRRVTAGSVWDAVSLVAADLIFRFETGGSVIGGNLIHAITSTNAMRFGFNLQTNPQKRLMLLLQGAAILPSFFLQWPQKENKLRSMNLVEDLSTEVTPTTQHIPNLFTHLPLKSNEYDENTPAERKASDEASRSAFPLLQSTTQQQEFLQTARSLLCRKATSDPHDFKYPAAAFEDAAQISQEWRPYILASTLHALHGQKSTDSQSFTAARQAGG